MSAPAAVLKVRPAAGPVNATARAPGSKSFTNRALAVAAVADGISRLRGALDSEDTRVMIESLRRLGAAIDRDEGGTTIDVRGTAGPLPAGSADLYLANSGVSIRFLTALVSAGRGEYRLDGDERMRDRPIGDLLGALRSLGVDVRAKFANDCPPVIVRTVGLPGGRVSVRGAASSQFLSALLIAAPLAQGPVTIDVEGPLVSVPYVDMTLATMGAFGVRCRREADLRFHFDGSGGYVAADYRIEPDASAASYFFGAAAVTGGTLTVEHLGSKSLQGDLRFVDELRRMGCDVDMTDDSTTVRGRPLHGVDADLCHLSDTVPTLAAVACFADSPTRIHNVAHIRRKECDRITALTAELTKAGVDVDELPDGLVITPRPIRPTVFDTYRDHRMAMSLALIGLRVSGIEIRDPGCVGKTYPAYFEDLAAITP